MSHSSSDSVVTFQHSDGISLILFLNYIFLELVFSPATSLMHVGFWHSHVS
jgi:hypothetical protein